MNNIINIRNPTNILQQPKSAIITNPLIPNTHSNIDIEYINNHKEKSAIQQLHSNIASSCIGLLDDLLQKPSSTTWNEYIIVVLKKDDRYNYIGILILVVAFFILLIKILRI